MVKAIGGAILTLVVGLLLAKYAFNLGKEYVDLRYTLSDKLPTKFTESTPIETVQQLTVKNIGNIPAKNIQVKIDGGIVDFSLSKHSIKDSVVEHLSSGRFQSVYPSLPSEAQFIYIFRTSGASIQYYNLSISHDNGIAQEALSKSSGSTTNTILTAFLIICAIGYFIMIGLQGRSMSIDRLESIQYTNHFDYLSKKKPLLIDINKWSSLRINYINNFLDYDHNYYNDAEDQTSYSILNGAKPEYINDEEWSLMVSASIKHLENYFNSKIKSMSRHSANERLLLIPKPTHFPKSKWDDIKDDISKNFIICRKLDLGSFCSLSRITSELNESIPDGLIPQYWDDYKSYLFGLYYDVLHKELLFSFDPIADIQNKDISILPPQIQESLFNLAYSRSLTKYGDIDSLYKAQEFIGQAKPDWIKDDDYNRLMEKANTYLELDKNHKYYRELHSALSNIHNRVPLNERPDVIDAETWENLIGIDRDITLAAAQNNEDKLILAETKTEVMALKSKILKQLEIIDKLLSDPNIIEKIEDYDNPFASGNLDNLRRIAKLLIQANKDT